MFNKRTTDAFFKKKNLSLINSPSSFLFTVFSIQCRVRLVTVAALCTNKLTENVYISCSFSTRPTGTPLHVELSSMNGNNTLSRPVRLRQFLYCLVLCGYHHFSSKFLVANPAKNESQWKRCLSGNLQSRRACEND